MVLGDGVDRIHVGALPAQRHWHDAVVQNAVYVGLQVTAYAVLLGREVDEFDRAARPGALPQLCRPFLRRYCASTGMLPQQGIPRQESNGIRRKALQCSDELLTLRVGAGEYPPSLASADPR